MHLLENDNKNDKSIKTRIIRNENKMSVKVNVMRLRKT